MTNLKEIWKGAEYKGDQLFTKGLYEEAIIQYKKEDEGDKFSFSATLKIANTYKIIGKYDLAKNYYEIEDALGHLEELTDIDEPGDIPPSITKILKDHRQK